MPRSLLPALAMLLSISPGSAQASDPPVRISTVSVDVTGPASHRSQNPDLVISRLMSFDNDRDGRVAAEELPERMQPLLARGDADGNGSIDAVEARALIQKPFARATTRGAMLTSGVYGFAEDITLSSRSHVEGAIDDLRLPADSHQQARAIAARYMDAHESSARAAFLGDVAGVLPAARLALFEAAVDRALQPTVTTGSTVAEMSKVSPATDGTVRVFRALSTANGVPQMTLELRTDLTRFVASQSLTPEQRTSADAAVQRLKDRLRLDVASQEALLQELNAVLDDESRENLRASLARRPVVATGTAMVFATAATGRGEAVSIRSAGAGRIVAVPLGQSVER